MKAEELKRLNRVQTKQGIFYIWAVGKFDVLLCPFLEEEPFSVPIEELEPIELTPDLLTRCGFKPDIDLPMILFKSGISCNTENMEFCYEGKKLKKQKYLHQIQNLYQALNHEELKFK